MKTRKGKKHSERVLTKKEESGVRDVYPSMVAMAGALKIPLQLLKLAKRSGSKGFEDSGRVHLLPVLEWIFSRDESSMDWTSHGKKFEALTREVKYLELTEVLVNRESVRSGIKQVMATLFSELDRLFTMEMPPMLKGLDEVAIRKKSEALIVKLKAELILKFTTLTKEQNT